MFPRAFKEEPPALCPACAFRCRVCPRSREGICAVPRVRRGPRSPGHAGIRVQLRAPTDNFRAGRGDRSRTPSRHRNALDRAGRASEQDAGSSMAKESATGRNAFRHGVNSGKHPSLSVPPPVLRERISPCPPSEHSAPFARLSCPLPRPDACKMRRSRSARSPKPMPVGCLAVSCCGPNRASQLEKS